MTLSDDLAFKIYQSLLDATGDAVNLQDFNRYQPFFQVPSVLETFEGRKSMDTPEALKLAFDKVQQGLQEIGATRMLRTCSVAQFDGPETIRGVHDTRLVDAEGRVIEAYCGMSTLRLHEGHWRIALSQFVEETVSLPSKTLRGFDQGPNSATAAQ
ncbi:hypothetical protein [Gymnodinialimonas sp.]